jgi:hypothetical protein
MPCDRPRSSMGTSTSTAAGRLWTEHHAHTVRIGRRAARSVKRFSFATTPRRGCEPPNASPGVMIFVAMALTLARGRLAVDTRDALHKASRVPL